MFTLHHATTRPTHHNVSYYSIRINKADASSTLAAQGTQWQQVSYFLPRKEINLRSVYLFARVIFEGYLLIQLSHTVALHSRSISRPTTRTSLPQTPSLILNSTRRSSQASRKETSHNQRVRHILHTSYNVHVLSCCISHLSSLACCGDGSHRMSSLPPTRHFPPYKMTRYFCSPSRVFFAHSCIGPSGTVKLAKKVPVAKPAAASTKEKKPAAKVFCWPTFSQGILVNSSQKATKATKPAGTKTAGRPKKTDTKTATKAAPKKASTTKAKAAPKAKAAKANTSTKRVKKTPAMVCHDPSTSRPLQLLTDWTRLPLSLRRRRSRPRRLLEGSQRVQPRPPLPCRRRNLRSRRRRRRLPRRRPKQRPRRPIPLPRLHRFACCPCPLSLGSS